MARKGEKQRLLSRKKNSGAGPKPLKLRSNNISSAKSFNRADGKENRNDDVDSVVTVESVAEQEKTPSRVLRRRSGRLESCREAKKIEPDNEPFPKRHKKNKKGASKNTFKDFFSAVADGNILKRWPERKFLNLLLEISNVWRNNKAVREGYMNNKHDVTKTTELINKIRAAIAQKLESLVEKSS